MTNKKRRRLKNKYRIAFTCILLLIFCASTSYLLYNQYNKYQEQKAFEALEKMKREQAVEEQRQKEEQKIEEENKQEEQKVEETQVEEETAKVVTVLPEYENLYEENDDLYGWIKIENTVIDYPVMYTPEEPNYYIHRDWKKEESKSGTLYVDGRIIPNETENTIIYGHHMKNGSMFGSLKKYKDISYYEEHKYIEFDTIYEKAKYEIVAVSKAVVYYQDGTNIVTDSPPEGAFVFYDYVELDTPEKFYEYIDEARENQYYSTGVTTKYGDKLITLCTCDYWTKNARLLVIAKKIE